MKPLVHILLCAAIVMGAASTLGAEPKRPPETAKQTQPAPLFAEVMVLHATNTRKGIDPTIGEMPELGSAPFSAYDSYALLEKARLALEKQDARRLRLPNGAELVIHLIARLSEDQVKFAASVTRPQGKEVLPLLEVKARVGQRFVVAGQSFKKGILVLVIRPVR